MNPEMQKRVPPAETIVPRRERMFLVVDDQFGRSEDLMICSRYGDKDKIPGWRYELEDAFDEGKGRYDAEKVMRRVRSSRPDAILLDMDYGDDQRGQGFGIIIMASLHREFPKLPVFIHSSTKEEDVIQKCLETGAVASIGKLPRAPDLVQLLNRYAGENQVFDTDAKK